MNPKQLHLHSLPLILLAIAVTAVGALPVSGWRDHPTVTALLRPAARLEPADRGFVQVMSNQQATDEQPGADIDMGEAGGNVLQATQATGSIGLQMALDEAAKK